MPKKKFTIDRKNWLIPQNLKSDEHRECSSLKGLRTGKRCCLGFICQQSGISDSQMEGVAGPQILWDNERDAKCRQEVEEKIDFLLKDSKDGYKVNKDFVEEAMHINDDSNKKASHKEVELIDIFAKQDIDIEFIGEYDVAQY